MSDMIGMKFNEADNNMIFKTQRKMTVTCI